MGDLQNRTTRRTLLVSGAALFAGTALRVSQSRAQTKGAGSEVVVAGYGGTLEQFMRNKMMPEFEKTTGIKVNFVVGTALSNYAKVVAARNNPEIDVYWSNELTHYAGKQLGLYEKIDPAIVTNMADVLPLGRDEDGIGVASFFFGTGIEYNSKAYADAHIPAPTSWNDLWDPRLKGKVALYSFNIAYSQDLLAILTRLAGGTEKDITPGIEKLKALKESGNLSMFASTPAELDNMLVQGQAWATMNGGTRAFILKNKGAPIDFSFPKEGAGFFANYFDIVKNAPHPKAAQVFTNAMISPKFQLDLCTGEVTVPINKKVVLPDALKAEVPASEEQMKKLIRIDRVQMNKDLDKWAQRWDREIEAKG